MYQRFGSRAAVARFYHVGTKGLAEREGLTLGTGTSQLQRLSKSIGLTGAPSGFNGLQADELRLVR